MGEAPAVPIICSEVADRSPSVACVDLNRSFAEGGMREEGREGGRMREDEDEETV